MHKIDLTITTRGTDDSAHQWVFEGITDIEANENHLYPVELMQGVGSYRVDVDDIPSGVREAIAQHGFRLIEK